MHSTNYADVFIAVAPDCPARSGTVPREGANPSVAFRLFQMIHQHPYRYTSDEVIFTVHAERNGIPQAKRGAAREAFFTKPRACLRACDLGKKYGWGIHHDAEGRMALYGVESPEYQSFIQGERMGRGGPVAIKYAMRSRR